MSTTYTVLKEAFRVGDLIAQERPNYESRKICTLAASQGAVVKGQVLGLINATTGNIDDVQSGSLVILATGASDVQTITVAGSNATFRLRYKGMRTAQLAYGIAYTDLQTAIRALHNDLSLATCANASISGGIAITTTAANMVTLGIERIDTLEIEEDLTFRSSASSLAQPAYVVHTTVGKVTAAGARVIALEDKANSGSAQNILCLVREALVKPGFLSYIPSSGAETLTTAQIALVNKMLEKNSLLVVLSGPTYNSAQDTVGIDVSTSGVEETVTTETIIAGL